MLLGVALRAQDGVWSASGVWWGLEAVLWAGAEECGDGEARGFKVCLLTADCCLTYDFC